MSIEIFVSGELSKNSQDEKVKINNQDPKRGYLEEKLDPNQFEIDNNNHLVKIKDSFLSNIDLTKSNIIDFNEDDYVHTSNDENIHGKKTFNDKVTFLDDIIIKGSVTEVESNNLNIDDNLIELNRNENGDGVSLGIAGILINRGTLPPVKFIFDESDDKWKLIEEGVSSKNITNDQWVIDNFAPKIHTHNPNQVGLGNVTNDAQLKRSANDFSSFSEKTNPVDNDKLLLEDSEDNDEKKYVLIKNLPSGSGGTGTDNDAFHKSISDEFSLVPQKTNPVDNDKLLLEDSEDNDEKKYVLISDLPGGSGTDNNAIHKNIDNEIYQLPLKSSPVNNDIVLGEDSENNYSKIRIPISSLGSGGSSNTDLSYGLFYRDSNLDIPTNQWTDFPFTQNSNIKNLTHDKVNNPTDIVIDNDGTYLILYNIHTRKNGAGHHFGVRLLKNNNELEGSFSEESTTSGDNNEVHGCSSFIITDLSANDVIKLQVACNVNITNEIDLYIFSDSNIHPNTWVYGNLVIISLGSSGGSSSQPTSSIPMPMIYGPLEVNENETNTYQITNFDNTFTYNLSFNDPLLSGTVNNDGTITVVSGDITDGNDHVVTMSIYSTKNGTDSLVNSRDITVKPLSYTEDSTESFEGSSLNEDNIEESDGSLV